MITIYDQKPLAIKFTNVNNQNEMDCQPWFGVCVVSVFPLEE